MYIASLILGILSLIFCWVPFFNVILALVALIISIVAVARKTKDKSGKGRGITGIILSCISIVISIIFYILVIKLIVSVPNLVQKVVTEISEKIDITDISNYAEAETMLKTKYIQIELRNKNKDYTGYINSTTEEYTDRLNGIEIDDFYEKYLKESGYDYDVFVTNNGKPSIDE